MSSSEYLVMLIILAAALAWLIYAFVLSTQPQPQR